LLRTERASERRRGGGQSWQHSHFGSLLFGTAHGEVQQEENQAGGLSAAMARRLSAGKRDALFLVYPLAAAFEDYDIVLVAGGRAVCGWQCKTLRGYPKRAAPIRGASFIMNGAAPKRARRRDDGWIVACESDVLAFLGSSLAQAVPRLWQTPTALIGKKAAFAVAVQRCDQLSNCGLFIVYDGLNHLRSVAPFPCFHTAPQLRPFASARPRAV
jgi:hypothetical protein